MKAPMSFHLSLALLLLFLLQMMSGASPGDLDTSFGNNGIVTTTVSATGEDYASAVVIQGDGKIVLAGRTRLSSGIMGFLVLRYNQDGTLDTTFNGSGKVATAVGTMDAEAQAIALQSNGKIVAAGSVKLSSSNSAFAVARYNANGSLDTAFGGTGVITTDITASSDNAYAVAVQSDGKIVAGGYAGTYPNYDFALVRYTTGGSLDTTFNSAGKVTTDFTSGSYDFIYAIAFQGDGKIVAAGVTGIPGDFALARYTSSGVLDTTFNGTGKVATPIKSGADTAEAVAIQSDGKIVVAGHSSQSSTQYSSIARYTSAGVLDTTFNATGIATYAATVASGVLIQADGKIITAGNSFLSGAKFTALRFLSDGSVDVTFRNGGSTLADFGGSDDCSAVAEQSDHKIVLVGQTSDGTGYKVAVARVQASSLPEISVEDGASVLVDGTANVDFGAMLTGRSADHTLTIRNYDSGDLTGLSITIDGSDASAFSVSASPISPVIGPGGSTTMSIRFAPLSGGAKAASLHLFSNDADESPFDITLTGRGLVPTADDDNDGISNEAEVNLAQLGFDPLVDSTTLRSIIQANAHALGLFTSGDVQALALQTPVLERDSTSGHFRLKMGLEKSVDLNSGAWSPLIGFTPSFDALSGAITIDIPADGAEVQFYRVFGTKP